MTTPLSFPDETPESHIARIHAARQCIARHGLSVCLRVDYPAIAVESLPTQGRSDELRIVACLCEALNILNQPLNPRQE